MNGHVFVNDTDIKPIDKDVKSVDKEVISVEKEIKSVDKEVNSVDKDVKSDTHSLVKKLEHESIASNISKVSYMLIVILVISAGYATPLFSCSMQRALTGNIYAKHLVGIAILFVFIMQVGGWSFDDKDSDKHPPDWTNGNCIDTMLYSIAIYIIFVLSSKARIGWNVAFLSLLFVLYVVNTQRSYYYIRERISEDTNDKVFAIEKVMFYALPLVLSIGVGDYYMYKKKTLGKAFNLREFIIGTASCKHG
tara:strand:- start:606 stop:1355 length:750 start_codon:yes stop_codon:yes gene_type:complete